MPRPDARGTIEVSDGARDVQDEVVCTGGGPKRVMAFSSSFSPSAEIAQWFRIIFGIILRACVGLLLAAES
jgi:hypothetical protein